MTGLTLEEFKAQQKAKQANLRKAEVRKHENINAKNVEKVEAHKDKVTAISSSIRNVETYNPVASKGENTDLLGFKPGIDEEELYGEKRGRGGRGGFRGDRGGFRDDRGGYRGDQRGGRGKRLNFNEEAFPTL